MAHTYMIDIDPADANLVGFASNVTGATWTLSTTATTDGLAHQVSIKNDAATDHSAKTAILTGTDADGQAQTETVNLPAGTATIESTKYFKTLTSVVPSATISTDTMDIGWVDEVASPTIFVNHYGDVGTLLQVDVTGTLSATLQFSLTNREDYTSQESMRWVNTTVAALVNLTGDVTGQIEPLIVALRLLFNSYSSGAELQLYIAENLPV